MNGTFRVFLVATCCMLWLCGCGTRNNVYLEENQQEEEQTETTGTEEDTLVQAQEAALMCYIYVCGAVVSPGVYMLPENSRIFEAIASAGGLTEDAAKDAVNQAAFVTDGQMLRIPTVEEAAESAEALADGTDGSSTEDGRLDINRATVAEFMTLPGIGQSKAESIVAYRESKGTFSSVEDLMKVDGIKEGVFNKIKNSIKVN